MMVGIPVYPTVDRIDVTAACEVLKWMDPDVEGKRKIADLRPVDPDALVKIYEEPDSAPSVRLDNIAPILAK
ncbi:MULTISPECIES: hypothetical protein [unclassified Mesorhizobium]|uniref:hypothetical protein n=1 Tax=unclassified Mesorhizobium TaxID=325217 RepID=UPI0003CF8443|nr:MULTISPECIES: hypothetical protein [unclassified Mesorhizobium]ESX27621.1 hypothetical protein X765_20615 [Mesorhizobium sp. LSHC440B00]ESX30068.1 hypothetical protein X763_29560 [Mesorhizobium sp. LSHC432A00]ESX31231.1 hypothetical protein X764_30545 [Mesorhizobium sp. LSHC440A00]WJI57227.1 hypothetical protein NLY33_00195 [Mesorhizobium sp. C432A]